MVPYQSPRGSIHDLEYIATLETDRVLLLCVSERTLYVLLNLTALDVTFRKRYAESLVEGGYVPVTEESPLYGLYRETVEAVQLEVLDMSCDLVALMQEWVDAVEALPAGQDWEGVYDVPAYTDADYHDEDPTAIPPPPPTRRSASGHGHSALTGPRVCQTCWTSETSSVWVWGWSRLR